MSRAMKDSGIPWIGEIPSHWGIARLKDIKANKPYAIVDGPFGSAISTNDYRDEGVPLVRIVNLTGKYVDDSTTMHISPELAQAVKRSAFGLKDIVFAKTGATVGKCSINNSIEYGILSSSCVKISIAETFNTHFFYYFFYTNQFNLALRLACGGSTRDTINLTPFSNLPCIIPPHEEQKTIADFLDKKCSEIDEMIALQDKIIEELKAYKQSVITEAVCKGLNPDVPMKDSGIEWIGEIPVGWRLIKLKYCLSDSKNALRVGPFGSSLSGNDFKTEGYWVYNQRSVLDNNFETNDTFIDNAKFEELNSFRVYPNDILITTRGSIGKIAVVPHNAPEGIIHPCIIRFVVDTNKYSIRLLRHIFNNSDFVLNQMRYQSNSTTIDVLYSYSLKNIILPLIPMKEQQVIADYLDRKCEEIDTLISVKQSKIDALKEYKKSIIYEYITGKKEVNG